MNWMTTGLVVVVLLLFFGALYFWYSGPMNADEEEKESVANESPEELAKNVIEAEKEDAVELNKEEHDFYSHG